MKFLSKKETKDLNHYTTPVVNLLFSIPYKEGKSILDLMFRLSSWYHKKGFNSNRDKKKMNSYLVSKFGPYCIYNGSVQYRNWGLEINGIRILFYTSIEGTYLEVGRDSDITKLYDVVKYIYDYILDDSKKYNGEDNERASAASK